VLNVAKAHGSSLSKNQQLSVLSSIFDDAPMPRLMLAESRLCLDLCAKRSQRSDIYFCIPKPTRRLFRKLAALPDARFLTAEASQLPFAEGSLGTVVFASQLHATRSDTLIEHAAALLRADGLFLSLEHLSGRGPFGRRGLAPESITCLLLNAGFVQIEQHWSVRGSVLTSARLGDC
jgi:SAM-dependent methyltransferase